MIACIRRTCRSRWASRASRGRRRPICTIPVASFVPAGFSSTYFAPWPKWMEMTGQPGHVIWHADGVKLESVEDLPEGFHQRMQAQFPERLRALPYVAPSP